MESQSLIVDLDIDIAKLIEVMVVIENKDFRCCQQKHKTMKPGVCSGVNNTHDKAAVCNQPNFKLASGMTEHAFETGVVRTKVPTINLDT